MGATATRRVWVTRAAPGAEATAGRLRALGHAPLVASLLQVRDLPPAAEPPRADTLAFTSANAVRAYARLIPSRDAAVWTVGAATAQTARDAGFDQVRSAEGDVAALAAALAADPPAGLVLHPRALKPAADLAALLAQAGVLARSLPVYETVAVQTLPAVGARALERGEVDVVLLHSPKAARTLAALLAAAALQVDGLKAVGLSEACLAPLHGLPFAALEAAEAPNEAALLRRVA